jgi:hypothetical protein
MNPLITILRASRCRSTHHCFALDALPLVQTDAGTRLARQLLRHHDRYLRGAIDPDIRYRDFQNHVIHVCEGYWGGAPRVAHQWYDRLQRYLCSDRLGDAAHATGVLSHYFTDVLQPLHTGICERERFLHRPIEWSVFAAYDAILNAWRDDELRVVFQLTDRSEWLGEAMLHGARFAHRKRQLLLDHYDVERFCEDPAGSLNGHCRAALAELFGLAITGVARIIERAAADAEAIRNKPLPSTPLALPTISALLDGPKDCLATWLTSRRRRRAVEQLLDEQRRLGRLETALPTEVDIVHRVVQVHHDEQQWKIRRQHRRSGSSTSGRDTDSAAAAVSTSRATIPIALPPRRRSA